MSSVLDGVCFCVFTCLQAAVACCWAAAVCPRRRQRLHRPAVAQRCDVNSGAFVVSRRAKPLARRAMWSEALRCWGGRRLTGNSSGAPSRRCKRRSYALQGAIRITLRVPTLKDDC